MITLASLAVLAGLGAGGIWTGAFGVPTSLGSVFASNPVLSEPSPSSDLETTSLPGLQVDISEDVRQLLDDTFQAVKTGDRVRFDAKRAELRSRSLAAADAVEWYAAVYHHDIYHRRVLQRMAVTYANWPGIERVQANLERAQLQSAHGFLRRMVGDVPQDPLTLPGKLALADAQIKRDDIAAANAIVGPIWRNDVLWESLERDFPRRFEHALTQEDHRARYFMLMTRERIRGAQRVLPYTGLEKLHDAWASVIRKRSDAKDKIAHLPAELAESTQGLFARTELARKARLIDEAAQLILQLRDPSVDVVNQTAWWSEIRIVARLLREAGDFETAYAVASIIEGAEPAEQVDAHFHAGWIALRSMKQPQTALPHFQAILDIANGPASRARGYYWLGRTHKAADNAEEARLAFQQAAHFATSYHGQLAAQELGDVRQDGLGLRHDAVDRAVVARHDAVKAAAILLDMGEERAARAMFTGMADVFEDPALLSALVTMLGESGEHFIGLRVAKRAHYHGKLADGSSHPMGALPLTNVTKPDQLALSYAIARQESEFRIDAVSHAGARGLLQLMPATAREVAGKMEMPYQLARLTTDPAYNTQLGTYYLAEQLARFHGSYILTFVAYNAGPGRAREWIERFGDPRGLPLYDAIDWVEQIPFPETRGYVQKVMENLQVYKTRLNAGADIERDLVAG